MKILRRNVGHRDQQNLDTSMRYLYIQLDRGEKVLVETKSYLVSLNDLISSIGGGLGLFLGFSILSTFNNVFDNVLDILIINKYLRPLVRYITINWKI